MCSIFGITLLDHNIISNKTLEKILTDMTVTAKIRGSDATGLSFVSSDNITIIKKNINSEAFVQTEEYRTEIDKFIFGDERNHLYSVLGHCRFETKGSHRNNDNNHPIIVENIVGTHNGQISNDDNLFKTYSSIKRIGEVDSEIIFSLVNYYSSLYKKSVTDTSPTTEAIIRTSNLLKGSYACSLIDASNPKILWLFRNHNPITVMHFKKEGVILFASTLFILQKATEKTDLSDPEIITINENEGICLNLEDAIYNKFKLNKHIDDIDNNSFIDYYYG